MGFLLDGGLRAHSALLPIRPHVFDCTSGTLSRFMTDGQQLSCIVLVRMGEVRQDGVR